MGYREIMEEEFPGTMTEKQFVKRTYEALEPHGFTAANTIACVAVCRDEITRPLVDEVHTAWGEAFNFSALGGMIFAGKTGFSAAHHHAPQEEGRERYAYFALPHIGVGSDGEWGVVERPGRAELGHACGALCAFRQEFGKGVVPDWIVDDDIEYSLMRRRLGRRLSAEKEPNLVRVTRVAYEAIVQDLERMASLTTDPAVADYAVLTGIQVHGPDRENFVWPGRLFAMVQGQWHPLKI